jgi:hypothetical protein
MRCLQCDTELIHGGDHEIEEESEFFSMVSNLSCPECQCYVEVYIPKEPENGKNIHTRQST